MLQNSGPIFLYFFILVELRLGEGLMGKMYTLYYKNLWALSSKKGKIIGLTNEGIAPNTKNNFDLDTFTASAELELPLTF